MDEFSVFLEYYDPDIEEFNHMTLVRCPFCGHIEDNGRTYRTAIYVGDNRLAIFKPGTPYVRIKEILGGVIDGYLVQEALDKDGRIFYTKQIAESDLHFNSNGDVVRHSRKGHDA